MNHYELLGVSPKSETNDIRRAYLAEARRHHPDYHASADVETRERNAQRMRELNQAWEVLGDDTARAAYDRTLAAVDDPGVARRAAREPAVPEGKGWTPRLGDDRWMDDYDGWASESDEMAPDEPRSPGRRLVTVLPVLLFFGAILGIFLGVVVQVSALIALGAACLILSGGLFVLLPMFEMARGRQR